MWVGRDGGRVGRERVEGGGREGGREGGGGKGRDEEVIAYPLNIHVYAQRDNYYLSSNVGR